MLIKTYVEFSLQLCLVLTKHLLSFLSISAKNLKLMPEKS